ncbi:glycoside hydrolase family 23 protein, partial [Auriscalpium vulgare]
FATLFLALVAVDASSRHDFHHLAKHHHRVSRRDTTSKRCKPRPASASLTSSHTTAVHTTSATPAKNIAVHTTAAAAKPASTVKSEGASNLGVIDVSSACGPSRGTEQVTAVSGPNGHIDFLNCGINSSKGWNPPLIHLNQLKHVTLAEARHTAFSACTDEIIDKFEQYGSQFGVPSIIFASFAMQESTCNPSTVGGGGEQGLMQITKDKCGGAPNGNCKDIDYNIRTGAKYFADTLNSFNGDVLSAVGTYNGWFHGMTYADATKAAHSSCCLCQQNIDYLMEWANGWIMGINAYDTSKIRLGKYFNLDQC